MTYLKEYDFLETDYVIMAEDAPRGNSIQLLTIKHESKLSAIHPTYCIAVSNTIDKNGMSIDGYEYGHTYNLYSAISLYAQAYYHFMNVTVKHKE